LHSDGKLTIVSLAAEAGLRRNKLTHKHTGLKDLFYALVRGRDPLPETMPESARARADNQQQASGGPCGSGQHPFSSARITGGGVIPTVHYSLD
ncbi:hypothetical protein ACFXMT_14955, partial [Streptomyces mirabilis]